MTQTNWILYGAYGYTGKLIAQLAKKRGHRPLLAGRSEEKLIPLAMELDLPYRAFDLDQPVQIAEHLTGHRAILNCAGPFTHTALPLVEACFLTGTHYLDITGEIEVFEALHELHNRAVEKKVALLPGMGFDVVPTDALARRLKDKLPQAQCLKLAFTSTHGPSRGTLKTALQSLGDSGKERRRGKIKAVPFFKHKLLVKFPKGDQMVHSVPWGDVSTAYYSTGIPNIVTYTHVPEPVVKAAPLLPIVQRFAPPLPKPVAKTLWKLLDKGLEGPSPDKLKRSKTYVWGRAQHGDEWIEESKTFPDGYTFTAYSALYCLEQVLAPEFQRSGFLTPSLAFGPHCDDHILKQMNT